jgi:membrane protein implicated in regulation of membrane protease activity
MGEVAVLLEDLPPGSVGKAELRGAVWRVRGPADQTLGKGQRCTVERVQGLDLWVRPE